MAEIIPLKNKIDKIRNEADKIDSKLLDEIRKIRNEINNLERKNRKLKEIEMANESSEIIECCEKTVHLFSQNRTTQYTSNSFIRADYEYSGF